MPGRPYSFTDEMRARAREMYKGGMSIRKIAAELGYSYGTVHRHLTDMRVTLRPHGGGNRKKKDA